MRQTTKEGLKQLAKKLSEEFDVEKAINSNEFLELAFDLADISEISLSEELIEKYEGELKRMCSSYIVEKSFTPEPQKPERKLIRTVNYYSDGTYVEVIDKVSEPAPKNVPNWTWFVEGEDGIIYVKGKFKGQLAGCGGYFVNDRGYKTSEYKYALHWIDASQQGGTDLTEDDLNVFTKIVSGTI
jgi:hypothetical protein